MPELKSDLADLEPSSVVRFDVTGRAGVITIDNPPVNVISQSVRRGLLDACALAKASLERKDIDRVIVTGAGRSFIAGADAREFDGPALEPHLPEVVDALSQLPAIAAINGAALGGGYEIALACRVRIAHPAAVLGLPEVTLGVVPGSGGTQLLPRLIGLERALPLISTGKTLKGLAALDQGLVDACAEDVVAEAMAWAAGDLARPRTVDRPAPARDDTAVQAARTHAQKRLSGQTAPLEAVRLMALAADVSLADGLAQERNAFLELRAGAQARALRHIFFAERASGASKALKDLAPAPIGRVLVVGGGTMGAAIAYAFSQIGLHVTLLEHDAAAQARAEANVGKLFAEAVTRGKLSPEVAANQQADGFTFLHGSETPLPPVDLAIEAVFENLEVKRALFQRLARELPTATILATNTSYLDVNAIFDGIPHPERCLGLHFFAPAHLMKLVEVIRAASTNSATLASAFALTKKLSKIAVEAGVCDGFIGNRILTRYRAAADQTLLAGALPQDVDRAMVDFGMAMGPYVAQDMSGLDIAYANRKRKRDTEGTGSDAPRAIGDHLVEDLQRLGRKSGAGWYDYSEQKPVPSPEVASVIQACRDAAGIASQSLPPAIIAQRLALAMIAEAADILDEGIASRPQDIDLVLVHGYGFPRWRGGPMRLADEWGVPQVHAALAELARLFPESWSVPALIARMADTGQSFADLDRTSTHGASG